MHEESVSVLLELSIDESINMALHWIPTWRVELLWGVLILHLVAQAPHSNLVVLRQIAHSTQFTTQSMQRAAQSNEQSNEHVAHSAQHSWEVMKTKG